MNAKPRIGLILLRAEWFDNVVALSELVEGVNQDASDLEKVFQPDLDLRYTWVVNSSASLQACVKDLRGLQLDLVVLAFQVWAEDFFLNPLIDVLNEMPLLVWCYQPSPNPPRPATFIETLRYSGLVGTLEGLGTLKNLGAVYSFVVGSPGSPDLPGEITEIARAGQAFQNLHAARFGLLPSRNEQMQSTFVDEFRLRSELGPLVIYLSVDDLCRAAESIPEDALNLFLEQLRSEFPIQDVLPETLARSARSSLGLEKLVLDRKLDLISVNDISSEMHTSLGLRPCLLSQNMLKSGAMFSLEGDLGAAVAVFALNRLTASPVFFTEFWFWDEVNNLMVGGHAGLNDPRFSRPGEAFISRDYEFSQSDETEGAHFQFTCRPGRVTLLQLRCLPVSQRAGASGWQAISFGGEVVDAPPWVEGYPHAIISPDVPVKELLRQAASVGTTQHWAMAYGDVRAGIRAWCAMEKIDLKEISGST